MLVNSTVKLKEKEKARCKLIRGPVIVNQIGRTGNNREKFNNVKKKIIRHRRETVRQGKTPRIDHLKSIEGHKTELKVSVTFYSTSFFVLR